MPRSKAKDEKTEEKVEKASPPEPDPPNVNDSVGFWRSGLKTSIKGISMWTDIPLIAARMEERYTLPLWEGGDTQNASRVVGINEIARAQGMGPPDPLDTAATIALVMAERRAVEELVNQVEKPMEAKATEERETELAKRRAELRGEEPETESEE